MLEQEFSCQKIYSKYFHVSLGQRIGPPTAERSSRGGLKALYNLEFCIPSLNQIYQEEIK